jgi:hypothetical protein
MAKAELEWTEIDTTNLPQKFATAYAAYRKAQDIANEKRKALDAMVVASLSVDGNAYIVNHKWGKMYAAKTDAKAAKTTTKITL